MLPCMAINTQNIRALAKSGIWPKELAENHSGYTWLGVCCSCVEWEVWVLYFSIYLGAGSGQLL